MGLTETEQKAKIDIDPQMWRDYRALNIYVQEHGEKSDPEKWKQWNKLRNLFVAKYYYLACRVSERVHAKNPHVEVDQLTSWGVDGLYEAVDGFDVDRAEAKTNKPVKFETYAPHRIKGAILDWIRRTDDVPRLVRQRAKKIKAAQEKLETQLDREPTSEEMAAELNVSVDDYNKQFKESNVKAVFSLDTIVSNSGDGDNGETSMMDCICDTRLKSPLYTLTQEELRDKLYGKHLTQTEKKIIWCYYHEEHTMGEIADMLGLSESRVSQIHSAVLKRIKSTVERNPIFFKEFLSTVKRRNKVK